MRTDHVCEIDFAVKWIDIVAVLVDFMIANRLHDVADLHSSFHGRHVWLDARYIDAAFAALARQFAQLRIFCWKKREPDRWKSAILLALRLVEKMSDDWPRDRVNESLARF